jgi:hypothetical protein
VTHEIAAPSNTDEEAFWDYRCGFVDERTVIASTEDSDADHRHHGTG